MPVDDNVNTVAGTEAGAEVGTETIPVAEALDDDSKKKSKKRNLIFRYYSTKS